MNDKMKIEYLPVGSLKPYEKNAKKHPAEQVEHIANSIREFGFRQPLVIDKDNVLVIGHGRLLAAKKLGLDTVPCVRADDLTDEQIKALRLADNKTNESEWDFDLLGGELDDIFDIDMGQFGFDVSLDDEPQEVVEDEVPEDVETRCKAGDIWQLGSHRLICGDSTDPAVIDRLMDGVKADIAFTSPPYGVGLDYNEYVDTFENTNELVHKVLPLVCKYVADYIVLNWGDIVSAKDINKTAQPSMFSWLPTYTKIMQENGWNIWAERIWEKVHARCSGIWSASSNRPVSDWEYIFTWANGAPRCNERKDGSHFGIINSSETSQSDTLSQHPGAFPVYVAAKVIQIHTEDNSRVLDPFGGSGSTLIACEQLNRKCYMCELDPHYCDVIIQRWENLTGETAVLLNG